MAPHMWDPSMTMDYMSDTFAAERSEFIQGCCGFAAGATVAVALRLFARWKNGNRLAADDLCISLSLLPLWSLVTTGVLIALCGGLGEKEHHLSPMQRPVFYSSVYAASLLYALAVTSAKLSILLYYGRIFTLGRFRQALYAVGSICTLWCVLVVFVTLFQCSPVRKGWEPGLEGSCLNLRTIYYGTAISNMILDVIINVLPVKMVWKLQLPLRQRMLLMVIMGLGVISISASIGRILSVPSLVGSDLPATIGMPFLFTIVEPAFAIICACLPTYRPLFTWFTGAVRNTVTGKSFSTSSLGSKRGSTPWPSPPPPYSPSAPDSPSFSDSPFLPLHSNKV